MVSIQCSAYNYINTITTTFQTLISIYRLSCNPVPLYNIYLYNFCHGTRGVIVSREPGSMVKSVYIILFPAVCRLFCIDIYAEHRTDS